MNGLMMDWPLVIPQILRRAAQFFPEKAIVSRWGDGTRHRMTYADLEGRVHRLMNALRGLGIQPGDRVATCAWNHHRHLELYFAVPSLGAVLHTINFRLSHEQLRYIINHAQDRLIFVDRSVAGTLAALETDLPAVEKFIVMDDRGPEPAALPRSTMDYEELLAGASERAEFPPLREEMAAGLCYTSATTGDPKGVLYSHRSTFLHAMAGCMVDGGAMSEREVALPAVPMFHVNAWGMPYSCTMTGATQVFPGSGVIGQPLAELLEAERVTCAAGVPTIWTLLYQHLKEKRYDLSRLHTILVGGSAASRALMENYARDFGIRVLHAWGMTETSPIGTMSRLKRALEDSPEERQLEARLKQGIPVVGVEAKLLGEQGEDLPWDGEHVGELAVRGPWIASSYYNNPQAGAAFTADGWFRTGDMASIDRLGYVKLTDRKKDLIKRKGEWISSVDMENAVQGHPGVLEAAVVARPDEVCDEVAAVLVVTRDDPNHPVAAQEILDLLSRKFAKWQLPLPEDIHFVAALPKTGVGKIDKKVLRKMLAQPPAN
ncbi:MAG TPA: long-chain fatty acid--CoA ligase [Isosphaeraceae bacterium]|nr:long-chain fatty acid--CoA ligase [Isosphaeraceae bacterium]